MSNLLRDSIVGLLCEFGFEKENIKVDKNQILLNFDKGEFYVEVELIISKPYGELSVDFSCSFYSKSINEIFSNAGLSNKISFEGFNNYKRIKHKDIKEQNIDYRYVFSGIEMNSKQYKDRLNLLVKNFIIFNKMVELLLDSLSLSKLNESFNLEIDSGFPGKNYFHDISLAIAFLCDKDNLEKYLKKYQKLVSKSANNDVISDYNVLVKYLCDRCGFDFLKYLAKSKWYHKLLVMY